MQKVPVPASSRVTGPIPDHPRVSVVISSSRPSLDRHSVSAPGSVHDDADDESELSELEEADADDEAELEQDGEGVEEVKKPIFPGLATVKDGRDGSSEYHSAEEGGDGDQDVQMVGAEAGGQTEIGEPVVAPTIEQ